MRLSVSIVALAVAGVLAHAHDDSNEDGNTNLVRRRKTLGFGPELPHATFKAASEMTASVTPAFTRDDAYVSAEWFVRNMLRKDGVRVDDHDSSYLVREDSYHDERTGVTHIYFRQLINGIEVTDANINVNIKDGKVISYGDSVCCHFALILREKVEHVVINWFFFSTFFFRDSFTVALFRHV